MLTRISTSFFEGSDLEAPVLGVAALGDVQVGHDLDAGDDRVVERLRRAGALDERAVDAVAQAGALFHRLEVDVAGVGAEGLHQHHVHHADHGGLFGGFQRLVDVLFLLLRLAGKLDVGVRHLHDVFHGQAGIFGLFPGLGACDGVDHFLLGGDEGNHLQPGGPGHLFLRHQVERVSKGNGQALAQLHKRSGLQAEPERGRREVQQLGRQRERAGQGDGGSVEIGGNGKRQNVRGNGLVLRQKPLEGQLPCLRQSLLELRLVEDASLNEGTLKTLVVNRLSHGGFS
jgi:hypothetical protein